MPRFSWEQDEAKKKDTLEKNELKEAPTKDQSLNEERPDRSGIKGSFDWEPTLAIAAWWWNVVCIEGLFWISSVDNYKDKVS